MTRERLVFRLKCRWNKLTRLPASMATTRRVTGPFGGNTAFSPPIGLTITPSVRSLLTPPSFIPTIDLSLLCLKYTSVPFACSYCRYHLPCRFAFLAPQWNGTPKESGIAVVLYPYLAAEWCTCKIFLKKGRHAGRLFSISLPDFLRSKPGKASMSAPDTDFLTLKTPALELSGSSIKLDWTTFPCLLEQRHNYVP